MKHRGGGSNLPLRVAVGRSSATCRRVWASHWPGTPSAVSPLWPELCPSWSGSTEAWLREQKPTPMKYQRKNEQKYHIKYAASEIVQRESRKQRLTAQISGITLRMGLSLERRESGCRVSLSFITYVCQHPVATQD